MNLCDSAVLLAAGRGERLGALGQRVPKPLLPVRGRPVLEWHLRQLKSFGVRQVFINTHHLADEIYRFVGDGSDFGLEVEFSQEEVLLGTSGALKFFSKKLIDRHFFVVYADNYIEVDFSELVKVHKETSALVTMALHWRKDVRESGMVAVGKNFRIEKFIEKPKPEEVVSHLVNAGVYVCSPQVMEMIPDGESDFSKDLFPYWLESGEILSGVEPSGIKVIPIDTLELYEKALEVG